MITRLRQGVSKRMDLALFRWQLNGRAPTVPSATAAKPVFFFTRDEVPARVSLLRKHLPAEVEAIISEADQILLHKFNLLGYERLDYGAEIDWHLDAVHQKRAPLKPWFEVPYLDFSQVGDHKVTWELNRHQHLVTLAKAWCFTSDKKYVDELVKQWYDWQEKNPYPLGINWASALEVAFRSLSWLWVKNLLAGYGDVPEKFHVSLLSGVRQNGRYIQRYHSKYFSPNTHLLGEAVALLYIGILCPEIPEAVQWRRWAWNVVVNESARQVRPDGVYFEQTLYYHVYALDLFLFARFLADRNGFVIPEAFDDTLGRMLEFLFAVCEGGTPEGFGDDDGGRVFNPRRNRIEHMTDPLALGAAEYQRQDWGTMSGPTEEAIWIFGDAAVQFCSGDPPKLTAGTRDFEAGGVYLIRDTEPFPQQLMIDAGPMGAATCGHGHADALSVRLSLDGHRCLIDPGVYSYMSAGDERVRFRGTAAHNTLRVDGVDQSISEGPFNWSSKTTTKTRQWLIGELFELFEGQHDGYHRLPDPVLHRRLVFHVKGAFWFLRDLAEGTQPHLLETFWHYHPEFGVTSQSGRVTASLVLPDSNGQQRNTNLHFLLAESSVWNAEIQTGEISPVYGVKQEASTVRVHATVPLPVECAVLLVPLTAEREVGVFEKLKRDSASSAVRVYRYVDSNGAHFIFCSETEGEWASGQWSGDARLFYCRIEDRRMREMALVGGSFAKWQDKVLMSNSRQVDRFEWTSSEGTIRVFSSSPAVFEYAKDDSFAVLDPVP